MQHKCRIYIKSVYFYIISDKLNNTAKQAEQHEIFAMLMSLSLLWCSLAFLTCAGHGARVGLGTVETSLAGALLGLFLWRRAVRRTLGAVGICGRRFVGAGAACCSEGGQKPVVKGWEQVEIDVTEWTNERSRNIIILILVHCGTWVKYSPVMPGLWTSTMQRFLIFLAF